MTTHYLVSPNYGHSLPEPITFRSAVVPASAAYPVHQHDWGEFVYSYSGVIEVRIEQDTFLVPPQYGFWLPAHVEHQGVNRYEAHHCSLYIRASLCQTMPIFPCALSVSPLLRSMLDHLLDQPPSVPYSDKSHRFLACILDQLTEAQTMGSYLPSTEDPLLAPILDKLHRSPEDNRTIAEWALTVHSTERTLSRRAQQELGMPLSEWRNRLRVIKAMPKLEAGEKVETIAFDLGYASASAFIAMFKRLTKATPDEYRSNVTHT
jgi:AraC-like DNA-binding protein